MLLALALCFILFAVCIHEFGHMVAMWKTGVDVTEFGLGLPVERLKRFSYSFTVPIPYRHSERLTVSLHPLLLGAFVRPKNEEVLKQLSYKDWAFVYGAGILANIALMGCFLLVFALMVPQSARIVFASFSASILTATAITLVGLPLFFFFARAICAYVFPVLSIGVLWMVVSIFASFTGAQWVENSGGMVALGQMAANASVTLTQVIFFGGIISYALAATNLLPFYPLDGGQIMRALCVKFMHTNAVNFFERVGSGVFLVLIVYCLLGDLRRIVLMVI